MSKVNALREQRDEKIREARKIHEAAKAEKREMNADENGRFDALMDESDGLKRQVDDEVAKDRRAERLASGEAEMARPAAERRAGREDFPARPSGEVVQLDEYRTVRRSRFSSDTVRALRERIAETPAEERAAFAQRFAKIFRFSPEGRALQMDLDTSGGYITTPEQFVADLIQAVDDRVFVRQLATIYAVQGAAKLGAASLDADPADADWTSEIATGGEDSTMAFGKRELNPHPLAKLIKVSRKLLAATANRAETIVRDRLAYKFGVTEEKAFLTGSGAGQPLGVFTASAQGISTSRDVSTDNTATTVTFDGLINAKYSVKGAYWDSLVGVFHRDVLKQIRKLKDGNGQYIWQPSVLAGEPDQLLDVPVYMSEYAPSTMTTGLYVGIFGNFSFYWIAEAMTFEIQRLVELYAASNQVGFIGRQELDGMPVLEEAFARVKLA